MTRKSQKTTQTLPCSLKRAILATGLHGVTGRPYVEGELVAGTLVRNVHTRETIDGALTAFQASTDGGDTWYDNESYEDFADLLAPPPDATIRVEHIADRYGAISLLTW